MRARTPITINEEAVKRLRPAPTGDEVAPPGAALGIPRLMDLGADKCVPCKMMAPIPLKVLMLAKTAGAILFGIANAFVPVIMASFLMDLTDVNWAVLIPAVALIAVSSTFLGLFIAVSVSEVFEAQTFSNFFRFPMIFLCGLFFPNSQLPAWLRPVSYVLPLTYGADALHGAIHRPAHMPLALDFGLLLLFCAVLFGFSLRNIKRKWIV
ncbi:MAG: ABC transporter permease [Kiritimatiellae bacterium]|nr:ABC transporter permease [Kiritimatiellia bacterium]